MGEMIKHPNGLSYGTVRRAPSGFAHAILLDQFGANETWLLIDLYGVCDSELWSDSDVAEWPIVYVPTDDHAWQSELRRKREAS